MTAQDKQLLLKDLCARVPYNPLCYVSTENGEIDDYLTPDLLVSFLIEEVVFIKLYLRPMSSMTEEEENEWRGLNIDPLLEAVEKPHTRIEDLILRAKSQYEPLDWLNAHYFDYRGLIEKSLAIVAPDNMYKTD